MWHAVLLCFIRAAERVNKSNCKKKKPGVWNTGTVGNYGPDRGGSSVPRDFWLFVNDNYKYRSDYGGSLCLPIAQLQSTCSLTTSSGSRGSRVTRHCLQSNRDIHNSDEGEIPKQQETCRKTIYAPDVLEQTGKFTQRRRLIGLSLGVTKP
jgi:hypothetical protein